MQCKWTSVQEATPELEDSKYGRQVLVTVYDRGDGSRTVMPVLWNGSEFLELASDAIWLPVFDEVLAWMYLPEPYEPEPYS